MKDNYNISKTSYIDIAKAIDFINEYTINVYCGNIEGIASPHDIQSKLYEKDNKLNSVIFQFAIDIMILNGYIATETFEGGASSIKNFKSTKKGIDNYFRGGMVNEIRKKKKEKWLIITGQASIILAGLYYLVELLGKIKY